MDFDIDVELLESENDEQEEEQITPAEVIQRMEEAWVNEKFAPEILPYRPEVDMILEQITYMDKNLENLSSTDFKKSIYQMEVDRLRFLASSYLRIRLEKIETYAIHILQQESQRREQNKDTYLSEQELKFAEEFSKSIEQYFNEILHDLPREDVDSRIMKPNMNSFVFLRSKKEVEGVIIDELNSEDLVDFKVGSQTIMSYNCVASLVKNGDVQLI